MLNVYEILSMQRVREGKSFFRVALSTSLASSPSATEVLHLTLKGMQRFCCMQQFLEQSPQASTGTSYQ